MKIEKITENKIRVLLKYEDIKDKNIDLHTIMTKAIESQGFFLEMLKFLFSRNIYSKNFFFSKRFFFFYDIGKCQNTKTIVRKSIAF